MLSGETNDDDNVEQVVAASLHDNFNNAFCGGVYVPTTHAVCIEFPPVCCSQPLGNTPIDE